MEKKYYINIYLDINDTICMFFTLLGAEDMCELFVENEEHNKFSIQNMTMLDSK